jgi:hypothetical protein
MINKCPLVLTLASLAIAMGFANDELLGDCASPRKDAEGLERQQLSRMLEAEINLPTMDDKMPLREFLAYVQNKISADGKKVRFHIDFAAFKELSPDNTKEAILNADVNLGGIYPRKMAVSTALRIALGTIPGGSATYTIRRGSIIEITTTARVPGEKILRVYPGHDLFVPKTPADGR